MRLALRVVVAVLLPAVAAAAAAANERTFDRQVPAQPRGVVEISKLMCTRSSTAESSASM